jgi:hypothetical protein
MLAPHGLDLGAADLGAELIRPLTSTGRRPALRAAARLGLRCVLVERRAHPGASPGETLHPGVEPALQAFGAGVDGTRRLHATPMTAFRLRCRARTRTSRRRRRSLWQWHGFQVRRGTSPPCSGPRDGLWRDRPAAVPTGIPRGRRRRVRHGSRVLAWSPARCCPASWPRTLGAAVRDGASECRARERPAKRGQLVTTMPTRPSCGACTPGSRRAPPGSPRRPRRRARRVAGLTSVPSHGRLVDRPDRPRSMRAPTTEGAMTETDVQTGAPAPDASDDGCRMGTLRRATTSWAKAC